MKQIVTAMVIALVLGCVGILPAATAAEPAIQLGTPFRDNAILQREMKIPVWGWSEPGATVTVAFAGQKKTGTAGTDGKWMVWLEPLKASFEPREMRFQVSGVSVQGGARPETRNLKPETIVLKNILVGEVWLASGQSNMQWVVNARGNSVGATLVPNILKRVEAKEERYPVIREFSVTDVVAMMHPIEKAQGAWSKGDNFGNYSAIAFAFAYKLFQELQVPIGILNCSFSQTSIQSWVPRVGFRDGKDEYTKAIYQKILETDPASPEHKKAWGAFYKSLEDQIAANDALVKAGEKPKPITAETPGNTRSNRDPSWLYNGKLHPVVPYGIRGAIWNQGYANSNEGLYYYNNLHSLIRGWRLVWNRPELPVYFHQFYTPRQGSEKPVIGGTPEMRMGTVMARDIPHSGMASQIDIGGTIHYQHKTVPGQRLALHALKNQYGQKKLVVDGPIFKKYTVKGNQLIVEFDHAKGGLVVAEAGSNATGEGGTGFANPKVIANGEGQVKLVYIADENRVWYPATIRIDGSKLIATSPKVKTPRGISYATGGVAFRPSLYNKSLLPVSPFIYYDKEMVLAETPPSAGQAWPGGKLKIDGEVIDESTVGKLYEWRKMPLLSTQFRDNAVLQAGKPLTFWGSTRQHGEWSTEHPDGKMVVHFDFNGIKRTIEVTPEMAEWQVTLPAMKASAEPHTLKVSATLDGELLHKREITGIVLGDVFYVAGAGGTLNVPKVAPSGHTASGGTRIVRMMGRKCWRSTNPQPWRFSVASSRTPGNRLASRWENAGGLPGQLGNAIAAKTGAPVGFIHMTGTDSTELKNWMPHTALAHAPSLLEDYKVIGAKFPGTPYYDAAIRDYIATWKSYWSRDIASIISTGAVPEGWGAWGEMPALGSAGTSTAGQSYNILTYSFMPTTLRGIIFLAGPEATKADDFGPEMSALANSWKDGFAQQKDDDIPFFYTLPEGMSSPESIKGQSASLGGGDWMPIQKLIEMEGGTAGKSAARE